MVCKKATRYEASGETGLKQDGCRRARGNENTLKRCLKQAGICEK